LPNSLIFRHSRLHQKVPKKDDNYNCRLSRLDVKTNKSKMLEENLKPRIFCGKTTFFKVKNFGNIIF